MLIFLKIVFAAIIYSLVYMAYGIGWQYILCGTAILGLMIVCSGENRNE